MLARIRGILAAKGFDVLHEQALDHGTLQRLEAIASQRLLPRSAPGGALLFTHNLNPRPFHGSEQSHGETSVDRSRYWALSAINHALEHASIHSGADCTEGRWMAAAATLSDAWTVLGIAAPGKVAEVEQHVHDRLSSYRPPFPVARSLGGLGANARVDLVDFDGQPAVCKLFRPGRERFFVRETQALTVLRSHVAVLPEVLASGDRWYITPFYEVAPASERDRYWLLPLPLVHQMLAFLRSVYDQGFAHMDFHPGNVLRLRDGSIKVIDFEYCHRYDKKPRGFEHSFDIVGPPKGFTGDLPGGKARSYRNALQPAVGLSYDRLRDGGSIGHASGRLFHTLADRLPRRLYRGARSLLQRSDKDRDMPYCALFTTSR